MEIESEAKQLKIAMLSVHSCPLGNLGARDTGGMSVYVSEVARELGKRGHLVDVYTRTHEVEDNQVVELGQNARLIHLKMGEEEKPNKLVLFPKLPDFACGVENFRKDNAPHYDLIYSHYWLSGCVGEILQTWWNVPQMIMFHTLAASKNALGTTEDEPELRIETERELMGSCQRIIAPTDREKEELVSRYGAASEKISIIPCGVDLELFRTIEKTKARKHIGFTDDKLVLFVGRIEPLKGIDKLLAAAGSLPSGQRPRLLIIGGDEDSKDEKERLQQLSRDLGIHDSVSFLGLIEHDELPYYYSAADLCVIPSLYESFGLVALESLACGTPVVASDVGDLRNIIRQNETGYVVERNVPSLLAEKMALFLSKKLDAESVLATRASVSRYSWPSIAEAVARECRSVMAMYPVITH